MAVPKHNFFIQARFVFYSNRFKVRRPNFKFHLSAKTQKSFVISSTYTKLLNKCRQTLSLRVIAYTTHQETGHYFCDFKFSFDVASHCLSDIFLYKLLFILYENI